MIIVKAIRIPALLDIVFKLSNSFSSFGTLISLDIYSGWNSCLEGHFNRWLSSLLSAQECFGSKGHGIRFDSEGSLLFSSEIIIKDRIKFFVVHESPSSAQFDSLNSKD